MKNERVVQAHEIPRIARRITASNAGCHTQTTGLLLLLRAVFAKGTLTIVEHDEENSEGYSLRHPPTSEDSF
jgi:hypothetical protein